MSKKRYLIDTHCLIWFQENNPKIPNHVLKLIQDPDNVILFSQISLFEIAIKQKIGKLPVFKTTIEAIYHQAINDDFTFLNIHNPHIYRYDKIPFFNQHRDPFDRLLIASAVEEKVIILSNDSNFKLYQNLIDTIW